MIICPNCNLALEVSTASCHQCNLTKKELAILEDKEVEELMDVLQEKHSATSVLSLLPQAMKKEKEE